MTPAFTARRRAEEFSSLVENPSTRELTDARYVEVLELVEAMRQVPPAEARPAFVADLRGRLMIAAETALVPSSDARLEARLTVAARRTPRERRLAVAMGGLALVGATTSMAVAAQTALPGDTLYPLKRALENAQAGVQVDEGDKGSTLLANATGRLEEVDELSRDQGDSSALVIAETLQAFTAQATEASDLLLASYEDTGQEDAISELRSFAADSMTSLERLEGLVPDEARGALVQAAQVLAQIDRQALALCPTCAGQGLTEIPPILLSPVSELLVTTPTAVEQPAGSGAGRGGKPGKGDKPVKGANGPQAPEPPAAQPPEPPVIQQPGAPAPGQAPGTQDEGDPLTGLTEGLTGGGATPGPSVPTSQPDLSGVLEDTIDGVTGLIG